MESEFASVFTKVSAWTEAICRDKQSILQSLRSPTVNVWKWWSQGSDTTELEIEMKFLKIKMVNIMEMWIKTGMLNMVVKCGGSVIVGSDPIFLFNCFSISILNPVGVFSMAFTSFTFAVLLALIFVNASSGLTFTSFTSLFSVLFSLLKFCFSYW